MADVLSRHDRLDVVCANADVSVVRGPAFATGTLSALDPHEWRRVIDITLGGPVPRHPGRRRADDRGGRGRIIVTASTASLRRDITVSYAYVTAKDALPNLVEQAVVELAPHGVTVNAIAPGPMLTNLAGGPFHDAMRHRGANGADGPHGRYRGT